jgi:hypothetical protein
MLAVKPGSKTLSVGAPATDGVQAAFLIVRFFLVY